MKTKLCPRCKQERLIEWFGDPKAPYAICLSCRVEVNGIQATEKQERQSIKFSRNCVICSQVLLGASKEICGQCESGLRVFNNSQKLLGRATSYVAGKLRKPGKKFKKFRRKNRKLQELVKQQRKDACDNYIRFEHAVSKVIAFAPL